MKRKLARIVNVGAIQPIPKADRIECASVGGWPVCIKKGEFVEGQRAVYFEIDAFLPQGNPHWEFLMRDHSTEFNGVRGHRLKSVEQRGQLSQGLLLPLSVLPDSLKDAPLGTDVSEVLNVVKYEKPLTEQLMQTAIGYRPGHIPSTDLMRIQNLEEEGLLESYFSAPGAWHVTEKLEGEATHYAFLDSQLHVCSTQLDFKDLPGNARWQIAHELGLAKKLAQYKNIVLQGELIGPGLEGNHYELKTPEFCLYRVLLLDEGRYLTPDERAEFAKTIGLKTVPVLRHKFFLDADVSPEDILKLAGGPSAVNPKKRREGLVFERHGSTEMFKVISNDYLLNTKIKDDERTRLFPAAIERLGHTCVDSGACHHSCKTSCFRRSCCAPLSVSGITDKEFAAA